MLRQVLSANLFPFHAPVLTSDRCHPTAVALGDLARVPYRSAESCHRRTICKEVGGIRQKALLRYPDLGDPTSIFSRATKVVEGIHLQEDPNYLKNTWHHPMQIAEGTAARTAGLLAVGSGV